MNPRQVTILWILAVALGLAVAIVKVRQQSAIDTATDRAPGDSLFEAFPAAEVTTVTLTDAESTLTLNKTTGGWVVAERDDYPSRTPNVLALLRTLGEIKIVQAMEAGPSFASHFGTDDDAKDADERGTTAAFADESGKEIARVTVGRNRENGGRFIRNHADESGFYAVNDLLMMFDTDPIRWLDDSFIRIENISSIHVAEADNPGIKLWHVTRETEDGDFRLADAAPGETLEATAGDSFKRLMGFARFSDVVPTAEVEARTATDAAKPRIATINTFEGFTYTFTIAPAKPQAAAADPDMPPPATDEQLLTVSVEATLPAERKKADDESDEAAAELDKAFAERIETLTKRLETERAFAGRTYVVAKSVVEPLLKERDDITAAPPEPTTATEPTPPSALEGASIGNAAGGGVTVTTPPIEIPSIPARDSEED